MKKDIRIKWFLLAPVLLVPAFAGFWGISYVPRQRVETLELRADSLLSVKLKLEEQLLHTKENLEAVRAQNKQLSDKILLLKHRKTKNDLALTNDELRKNLKDMAEIISNYQSQMKSLIVANEKLEKQVEALAKQLP